MARDKKTTELETHHTKGGAGAASGGASATQRNELIRPTESLLRVDGKVAIVSAAGQGLGQAIAFRLADAGASVVVAHKHADTADETVQTIRDAGGTAIAVVGDVSDLDVIDQVVATAVDTFGTIDLLANVAGGIHAPMPFVDIDLETYTYAFDRNLKCTFFLTQRAVRVMMKNGGGSIVNIASKAAVRPDLRLAAYNAAKKGVVSLAESLSVELAPHGIRINTILPGGIRTARFAEFFDMPRVKELVAQKIPLGRAADPDDIAAAALFCLSAAGSYMTGASMVVDGGFVWTGEIDWVVEAGGF